MWKYLVFNSLWFLILFLSGFSERKMLRNLVFAGLVVWACAAAWRSSIDPFGWFYYLIFSLAVYSGAERFRRWAYAKARTQQEELKLGSETLEREKRWLVDRSATADALGSRANQIALLYDKIKEMSQSLDHFETFVVFGETLCKFYRFGSVKLAWYGDELSSPRVPDEFFELHYADLENLIDRSFFLKDRNKAKAQIFPFDQAILEQIFKNQEPIKDGPLFVYPLLIQKKIFAVLILVDVDQEHLSLLNILTERFISELQRVRLYQKVEMLAITDGLTGAYARRHLLERLEGEMLRCKKFGCKLSFLMIDVDHFKTFNDQFGHLVGDVVLKQVAETVQKNIRELDLAGRYGGEEFGVILVDTDEGGAFFVAERICRAVGEKIYHVYDENLKVTVSIGCSTYSEKMKEMHLIVDAADSALYQAKQQGRNKVCAANLSEP